MPSQILHSLFAEDVYKEILEELKEYRNFFTLGCQGPDIFYHSQGRKPVGIAYGTLLHRRGMGNFSAKLLELSFKSGKLDALGAYTLGFITHPFLDRLTHPFIVYKSTFITSKKVTVYHAFYERVIDTLMLKHLRGMEPLSWDQEGLLTESCKNVPLELKEIIGQAMAHTFPDRAGKDEKLKKRIDNAFLDSAGFYHYTAPFYTSMKSPGYRERASSLKRRHINVIYPENLPDTVDFLNLKKQIWYYPAGEKKEDNRSFPEIYEQALVTVRKSLAPIIDLYGKKAPNFYREAAGIIGNGGLSITDESGFPLAPLRSEALPLDKIAEDQAIMRGLAPSFA